MGRRKPRRRPHGSIQQQGTTWRIRWREGGRRRSASFPDKETAEKVLLRIIGDVAAGRGGIEVAPRNVPSLSELFAKWIARREHTHRAWRDDRGRWNKHLKPTFGHLRPAEVDQAQIRHMIERKLGEGLSSTTCKLLRGLLSTFLTDVVEQGHAKVNPAKNLPKATMRLIKDAHDPKQTPFIEKQSDIAAVHSRLAQPFATIFIVGALTGMRPGEIISLEWGDVDLGARRILLERQVRHSRVGPTKNGKPRLVPIIEPLAKILAEWKLATGGEGLLFKPLTSRRWRRPRFISDQTVRAAIKEAFRACGLPGALTWYGGSRHTWASQLVMGGGSLAVAQQVLGHSSVTVTQRYAHLKPDLFRPEDLLKVTVDLTRRHGGEVIELAAHRDEAAGTTVGLASDGAGQADVARAGK